jgi:hypothetical protein
MVEPVFIKKALTHDPAALELANEPSRISDPYVLSDLTEDFRGNRRSVLLVQSCFDKDNKIIADTMVFGSGGVPVPLPRP